MDRNWNEILQELRVTQTGTQIFTGFLLTIAFQTRFSELTTFQVRVYLVLVVAAVLTTALGLAPVSLHRSLFRKGAKMIIVETAHVFMRITLVGVAVMLIGTVLLIFDLVVGRRAALIVTGVTLLVVIILAVLPVSPSLPPATIGPRSAEGDDHARQEEAGAQCQGRQGLRGDSR